MHSRTACAAAVMAVFALGSGAVTAQTTPHKHQRPAPAAKPGKVHKPVRIARAITPRRWWSRPPTCRPGSTR